MKIIVDTSTLYSPAEGEKLGITVLPLNVSIHGETYTEFVDMTSQKFLELVGTTGIPTSSQPSVGKTIEALEATNGEDTLVINMCDGLSGTYQSTVGAKATIENNEHIHIINSRTLCGPHRYMVQKAMRLRDEGKSFEEVKAAVEELVQNHRSFLIVADFGFLKRGGRLTPLAATVGGLLKIVPVMTQSEDWLKLEKFAVKRTYKGAIDELAKSIQKDGIDENYILYVSHAGVLEKAEATKKQLQGYFPNVEIQILDLSPAFITQGGPGCVAIQYCKR